MAGEQVKPRVLVVDDDPAMRLMVGTALAKAGFDVADASNGREALTAFSADPTDLVLLDVMMPDLDGFAVCNEIRQMPAGREVPIAMLTGLEDTESVNRAYQCGATDFITKPINWNLLGHRARFLLRASQAFIELGVSERRNRALLDAMPDLMVRVDRCGSILDLHASASFPALAQGKPPVGAPFSTWLSPEVAAQASYHLERALATRTPRSFEFQQGAGEQRRSLEARLVVSGEDEVIAIIRDITERRQAEARIEYLAYHDALTGLANRALLNDRARMAMAHAQRTSGQFAVFLVDIDRFRNVNDSLGHPAGDKVLEVVARRLEQCVQHEDTAARLSGDEFLVLAPSVRSPDEAMQMAEGILALMQQPIPVEDMMLQITVSIGVSLYPNDGMELEILLRNADAANSLAKEKGRSSYRFFLPELNRQARERLDLEQELRRALANHEFELHYQAKIRGTDGAVTGVEALIRWRAPDGRLISPATFIPLAEDTGLILPLGDWVLQEALAQQARWQQQGLPLLRIAVNISNIQFRQENFVSGLKQLFDRMGAQPSAVELEITESLMMESTERSVSALSALRAYGFELAIDDFGTGYSSLNYLRRLPVDVLKIDQAFVRDMLTDPAAMAIVDAIITLGSSLGMVIVAEGVETPEQADALRQRGCTELQGYLFSRPIPGDAFADWFRAYRPTAQNGETLAEGAAAR